MHESALQFNADIFLPLNLVVLIPSSLFGRSHYIYRFSASQTQVRLQVEIQVQIQAEIQIRSQSKHSSGYHRKSNGLPNPIL